MIVLDEGGGWLAVRFDVAAIAEMLFVLGSGNHSSVAVIAVFNVRNI